MSSEPERIDPEQRESDEQDRAAERAADATEEARRRRGEDDVRVEDEDAPDARPPLDSPEAGV